MDLPKQSDGIDPADLWHFDIQSNQVGLEFPDFLQPGVRVIALTNYFATNTLETKAQYVGSSRVDLQACKLEYSIVSPK